MAERLKKEEIEEKVNKFTEDKNIDNPLFKECIMKFVKGHNSEFGEIISTDDIIQRLYENLDRITFVGEFKNAYGEYVKKDKNFKDKNEILIYKFKSSIQSSTYIRDEMSDDVKYREKKRYEKDLSQIKSVIIHELTHAAYTKVSEEGDIEHIFTTITDGQNFFDEEDKRIQYGNSNFVEGIVNYIAREIEGKNDEDRLSYRYQTKAIYLLAYKIGDEKLIKSAWNSDEELFKKSYMETIKKPEEEAEISYEALNDDMGKLKLIEKEEKEFTSYIGESMIYINHIENLLNGKTYLPIGETKSAFEDVLNIDTMIISSMQKATIYVKEKYKQMKEIIKNTVLKKDTEEK